MIIALPLADIIERLNLGQCEARLEQYLAQGWLGHLVVRPHYMQVMLAQAALPFLKKNVLASHPPSDRHA
jgi:hypothetical protein